VKETNGWTLTLDFIDLMRNTSHSLYRKRMFELINAKPGDKILDFGAGHGIDTIYLGNYVRPGGEVIGIDFSIAHIAGDNIVLAGM
jgi:ubiquinone/menaquinone biosynthesis C-methylase UbiE